MSNQVNAKNDSPLFVDYFKEWVMTYKENAIRDATMKKYKNTLSHLKVICPEVRVSEIDRICYQKVINAFAKSHEKNTVMDFHHHLKACILDALDDGYLIRDPTRKVVIKGCAPRKKKQKYLNTFELQQLLRVLKLDEDHPCDWMILLASKTGLRFSEVLGITPKDFDFEKQTLSINKTWDYKNDGGFVPTKNRSSIRKITIDWQLVGRFAQFCKNKDPEKPIFVREGSKTYSSTANSVLTRRCKEAGVPAIGFHGLRHTHASILLASGVTIASVSNRLGHGSMETTQKVYLHIVKELESKDTDVIMRSMATLI